MGKSIAMLITTTDQFFSFKEEILPTICHTYFLKQFPCMWGGLVNESLLMGVGVLHTICHPKTREAEGCRVSMNH